MLRAATVVVAVVLMTVLTSAQARRGAAPAPAAATRTEPAKFECPSPLGVGVKSGLTYCDVLTGARYADGLQIQLPPHTGTLILRFDLHNRHLYSEELVQSKRGYRKYTATIGVMTDDSTLLSRFAVQSEFRTAADLVDRVAADAGGSTLKAVAPTGLESVVLTVPAGETTVSIVGEKLAVIRADAPGNPDNFNAPGRPVALVSNVTVEYRPAAARRTAPRR